MTPPVSSAAPPVSAEHSVGANRFVASAAVVASPLADGLALLDTRTGSYFTLNGTAALLWRCATEPVTLSSLCASLAGAFGRPEAAVENDVQTAIRNLVDAELFDVVAPE